ncbi:hypothetical protein [Aporhodopirellula aestuarii]|uniref:Uncharacterized protein n=1 Tax=Aporhodopirellula aestuarii TaxID=2950107 RepID=A0ABT0TZN2_9BACT|nr:hypothetical protein [Aporhodopirellula aestuarii]MCM2370011.1 hypothetical protein [Aporhodopirellula aestuarii]
MTISRISIALVVCLAVWRGVWLMSGVSDTCAIADGAAAAASELVATQDVLIAGGAGETNSRPAAVPWRISFANWEKNPDAVQSQINLRRSGTDLWDASLAVWITPGNDGQPGWATWDDNGDGVVDDPGELGAAWSDDFCVVQFPGAPAPAGRVIDRGGFRPITPQDARDPASGEIRRVRLVVEP